MKKNRLSKVEERLTALQERNKKERYKIDFSRVSTEALFDILEGDSKIENVVYNSELDNAFFMSEELTTSLGLNPTDFKLSPFIDEYRAIPKEIVKEEDILREHIYIFNLLENC